MLIVFETADEVGSLFVFPSVIQGSRKPLTGETEMTVSSESPGFERGRQMGAMRVFCVVFPPMRAMRTMRNVM